jgi:hypothetical protein
LITEKGFNGDKRTSSVGRLMLAMERQENIIVCIVESGDSDELTANCNCA